MVLSEDSENTLANMVFQAEKRRGARIVILAYKNSGPPSMDLSLSRKRRNADIAASAGSGKHRAPNVERGAGSCPFQPAPAICLTNHDFRCDAVLVRYHPSRSRAPLPLP